MDVRVGDKVYLDLKGYCESLAARSFQAGISREEFRQGLRSTTYKNYVIFFTYEDKALLIIRVLHGARDIGAGFFYASYS